MSRFADISVIACGSDLLAGGVHAPLRFQGVVTAPGIISEIWSDDEHAFQARISIDNGSLGTQSLNLEEGCSCDIL